MVSKSKTEVHRMKTFIVDAFTDTPFKGNPAGVCMVDPPLADQRIGNRKMVLPNRSEYLVRMKHACLALRD